MYHTINEHTCQNHADDKLIESPCNNCQVGWSDFSTKSCSEPGCNGTVTEVNSCRDECGKYQEYISNLKELEIEVSNND